MLEMIKTVQEWKPDIQPVLESKANEFIIIGYRETTSDDIWNCLMEKVWKGNITKHLYEVVQDVFHLSSNVYMGYLTVHAHQNSDLSASIAALTE